ncbi:FAD-dependent oxidoreductase [bacterium]|nr:FAD-dependent oxidoreductase [bacterium]
METLKANIPLLRKTDVLVLGGSLSGIACALSAKAHSLQVILVEDKGFLGGALTASWETASFKWNELELGDELYRLLNEKDNLREYLSLPEKLKIRLEEICREKDIPLLYWCRPIDLIIENNRVKGVIFASEGGIFSIECSILVDATPFAQATSIYLLTPRPFPYIESRGFLTLSERTSSPFPSSLLICSDSENEGGKYCRLLQLYDGTNSPTELSTRKGEFIKNLVVHFHPLATAPFSTIAPLRYPPTYRTLYLSDALNGKSSRYPIAKGKGNVYAFNSEEKTIRKLESKEIEVSKEFFISRQINNLLFTFGDKLPLRPGIAWMESLPLSWQVGKALGSLAALSLKLGLSPHDVKGTELLKELRPR